MSSDIAQSITVLLIGKTGAGKSCLGNRLLGYKLEDDRHLPFKVSSNVESETSDMKIIDGSFFGRKSRPIRVIDCPGLADSKGRDDQFAPMLSEMMKNAGHVNVLLWCRNGQEDRIDINEWQQLATCRELFGAYLFENMVMNLSKWAHDGKSEKRRQQSGKSFVKFRTGMWEKVTNQAILGGADAFPVFALDAMYDEDDDVEVKQFKKIREEMWKYFLDLSSKKVFTKEVLQEQIERQKAEEAKTKMEKEEEERKKIEAAVNNEVEKVKTEQQMVMEKLQEENQKNIDAKVRAVQEEQEKAREQAQNDYQMELQKIREEQENASREVKEEQEKFKREWQEAQDRALKEAEAGAQQEMKRRMQMLQEEHEKAIKIAEEKEKEHQRQLRENQKILEEEQKEIRKQAREQEERARREAEENMERAKRKHAEEMEEIRRAAANEERRRIQEQREHDSEIAAAGQRSKKKRSKWVKAMDIALLGVPKLFRALGK